MKKFVMLDSHTLDSDYRHEKEILGRNGYECELGRCVSLDEAASAAAGAEVIGVCYFKVTAELLDRLPGLKGVVRYGIGYDVVDVDACTARGVMLCNLPTFCVVDVATHAMGMLLDLCRKITFFDREARRGSWDVSYGYPIHRLEAMTLGLVGFGNTARLLAGYVKPFGMKVLGCDPFVDAGTFREHGVEKVALDDLWARSDALSVHVPIIPSTRHLIAGDSIAKMRDGVFIVNTARGPVVKLDDLVAALRSGKVAGAALDVFEGEPITDMSHPIYGCENLIITPHVAYASVESGDAQHSQAAETAVRILAGEMPPNTVNRRELAEKRG